MHDKVNMYCIGVEGGMKHAAVDNDDENQHTAALYADPALSILKWRAT